MDIYGNKLVNTIETQLLCFYWSNLVDMLTMLRGLTLLILKDRGQRSRSQWSYMEISVWLESDKTVVCFLIKLSRHVRHGERMKPIDFGGKRSKVKVTMDILYMEISLWTRQRLNRCVFFKPGRDVNYGERIDSIDIGGKKSKVKVTVDTYGNKLWT